MSTSSNSLPSISIITATFNVGHILPNLIASLKQQTDQDFEWIVADGESTDNTLNLLDEAKQSLSHVIVDSRPDFGIYDALNRAIRIARGDYYLVAGADDLFFPEAVANYKAACQKYSTDFVTAKIKSSNGCVHRSQPRVCPYLYGAHAYVSAHAVGLAIRRTLHDSYGVYSKSLPIAADELFILKAIKQGATVSAHNFVAGRFENNMGTSGQDILGTLVEGYRAKVATGHSLFGQSILLLLRIWKYRRRIKQSL